MDDQAAGGAPVIVALPAEIDADNVGLVFGRLCAPGTLGAPVIIADLSATSFCAVAGMHALLAARHEVAATGSELRLVIRPGSMVRRMMVLLEADHLLPVYSSVAEATDAGVGVRDPLSRPLLRVGPDGYW